MLHQTLHRHTEELFAQWSSLPKWIKAGKEQVGGSRRENPKTGAWSRAGPNNVCYTNRAIPHHVCETSTQRDNCISPHTERTEETLKSQIWKQQRHLYICSTTFVFHVFIQRQSQKIWLVPLHGHCFNPWILNTCPDSSETGQTFTEHYMISYSSLFKLWLITVAFNLEVPGS